MYVKNSGFFILLNLVLPFPDLIKCLPLLRARRRSTILNLSLHISKFPVNEIMLMNNILFYSLEKLTTY